MDTPVSCACFIEKVMSLEIAGERIQHNSQHLSLNSTIFISMLKHRELDLLVFWTIFSNLYRCSKKADLWEILSSSRASKFSYAARVHSWYIGDLCPVSYLGVFMTSIVETNSRRLSNQLHFLCLNSFPPDRRLLQDNLAATSWLEWTVTP